MCSSSSRSFPHKMQASLALGSIALTRFCLQCPPAAYASKCLLWCLCALPVLQEVQNARVRLQSIPCTGARRGRLVCNSVVMPVTAASMTMPLYKCNGACIREMPPKVPQMRASVSIVIPAIPIDCSSRATGPAGLACILHLRRSLLARGGAAVWVCTASCPPVMYSPWHS